MSDYKGFIWKGQRVKTYGELGAAAAALTSAEEGQMFMAAYRSVNEHADANIGYLSGYYDNETANRIKTLTRTAHPVFD